MGVGGWSHNGSRVGDQEANFRNPDERGATPRKRRQKSPNGAGGVYFNQATERWMGRYTTEDPETGLAVRKAVYGRTEQEARARLIKALAARQDGTLLVGRGRELTVRQYAERWLAALLGGPKSTGGMVQRCLHGPGRRPPLDVRPAGSLGVSLDRPLHRSGQRPQPLLTTFAGER
jgi:hypothetical protein